MNKTKNKNSTLLHVGKAHYFTLTLIIFLEQHSLSCFIPFIVSDTSICLYLGHSSTFYVQSILNLFAGLSEDIAANVLLYCCTANVLLMFSFVFFCFTCLIKDNMGPSP